ncbi:MAG TPA: SGNH/GDSL hydrolase family protein [Nitrospira sp.]|nr:SGNH/GDSL hydrolase family protein [Nitrospira sp.]
MERRQDERPEPDSAQRGGHESNAGTALYETNENGELPLDLEALTDDELDLEGPAAPARKVRFGWLRPSRHPALWTAAILLVELVLLFSAAEFIAGWFLPPGPRFIHPQMIMEPDARKIYYHRPNQRAFTIDRPFVTNSLGFRDGRELPAEKAGEFRIMTLGDAATVGVGVTAEEAYPGQFETLLHHRAGPVRVVNAGVSGYSTWQEVEMLKEYRAAVDPDIVTLTFYWDDLYPKPDVVAPIRAWQSGDRQDSVRRYLRFLKRSRTLLLLWQRGTSLVNAAWPGFDWKHRDMILQGGSTPYLERAYGDVEIGLREFSALARDRAVPILLIMPMPVQVRSPEAPPTIMQRRISAMARRAGLRAIDLLPAMRAAYAEHRDLYIPWDHEQLSARGHAVVAGALYRYLIDEGLIPSSPSIRTE